MKKGTEIGKVIKSARIRRGLNQIQLGEKLNDALGQSKWTQYNVSRAESGAIPLTEEEIDAATKILCIELTDVEEAIQSDSNQRVADATGMISMDAAEITSEDLAALLEYVNSIGGKVRYGLVRKMLAENLHNKGIYVFHENSVR